MADDAAKTWGSNRREITARTREYGADLGDISRMFQRAVMTGSESQRAELKSILTQTRSRLTELLDHIDNDKARR